MATPDIRLIVDISGIDRLTENLRRSLADVVFVAAHNVETTAKYLVRVKTGATRSSIFVEQSADGLSAVIGPTTFYAPYLEFGTHGRPAYPFMTPAAEMEARPFRDAIAATVQREAQSG